MPLRNVLIPCVYYDLTDIFRERNPLSKVFAWKSNISPGILCRLDYFLISRQVYLNVQSDGLLPGLRSDHYFVTFSLIPVKVKRGPGYWKVNNSLLDDPDHLKLMSIDVCYREITTSQNLSPLFRWGFLKYNIRKGHDCVEQRFSGKIRGGTKYIFFAYFHVGKRERALLKLVWRLSTPRCWKHKTDFSSLMSISEKVYTCAF